MNIRLRVLGVIVVVFQSAVAGEIAIHKRPLKSSYKLDSLVYKQFYQTGARVDSYSMVCDMGQAIPDSERSNWYTNKPIKGLKLELRAKAAILNADYQVKPIGFVVVTKNNEELIVFTPLGDYVDGVWEGDVFNSWSGTETDIEVFSERFGRDGYAHFDLIDGNGFYYKSDVRKHPDYFLSDCKRIKKENLPVYGWK